MSFWEWMVVLLVALLVISPKRLPEIAYRLGQVMYHLQQWYHSVLHKFNTPP